MAVVVSDAGPLIALAKTDSLFVLQRLFSQATVPDAVRRECAAKEGIDSRRIEDAVADGWLSVAPVQVRERFPRSLGQGEIEAIQLALDAESALLIMDDRLARREAMRRGLDYLGTVGLLHLAEQRSVVDDAGRLLRRMATAGYRISPALLDHLRSSSSADLALRQEAPNGPARTRQDTSANPPSAQRCAC